MSLDLSPLSNKFFNFINAIKNQLNNVEVRCKEHTNDNIPNLARKLATSGIHLGAAVPSSWTSGAAVLTVSYGNAAIVMLPHNSDPPATRINIDYFPLFNAYSANYEYTLTIFFKSATAGKALPSVVSLSDGAHLPIKYEVNTPANPTKGGGTHYEKLIIKIIRASSYNGVNTPPDAVSNDNVIVLGKY